MRRLLVLVVAAMIGATHGCVLEHDRCGQAGVGCPGTQGVCVCATGRCADPDPRCPSGFHYIGSRCVPESEAPTAIRSTSASPGVCTSADADAGPDALDAPGDVTGDS
ncbi:MAG: hypothetical protein QME96_08815 [Myxococcota bacterium]|nr:hypothetical protein [Myxococcota bacterium]